MRGREAGSESASTQMTSAIRLDYADVMCMVCTTPTSDQSVLGVVDRDMWPLAASRRWSALVASKPFTLPHFRNWARQLELDDGHRWKLEPFQEAFIEDVFSGYKVCWLVVPEGNGKTTLLAGLGLYVIEFLPDAYVPVAASSRDQAEWIYRQAAGFINRAEWNRTFKTLEGYRRIRFDAMRSRIQIFAADDRSGDGIIPGGYAFLDELHRHHTLDLYRTWQGKLWKRKAQLVIISTAGEAGGEFEEERARFRQEAEDIRREGRAFTRAATPNAVLHEWALPEDGDPEDLELVKEANPFSGVTLDYLNEKRNLPGMTVQHWSRFTCNLASRAENAAIQEREWGQAATTERIPIGQAIWAGLDVGWKWDTTALVPFWWRDNEFRLLGPATILEPPRDGSSLDPGLVERALIELNERNPLHTVVMDMSRAEQLAAWMSDELGVRVIDRSQANASAVDDYEKFMEALRMGWLKHSGDMGLTRHALNAVARVLPQGDARFDRPHDSRFGVQTVRVVDALIAAAMVHAVAATLEEPVEFSVAFA